MVIAPSNPIVSVAPILATPGIREALDDTPAPIVAVSPIVGGRALKGPAAQMLATLGHEVSALGVARLYAGLIDGLVIDEIDRELVPAHRTHWASRPGDRDGNGRRSGPATAGGRSARFRGHADSGAGGGVVSERIVAVVPVRSLRHGKTRLSPCSVAEARATLLRGIADGLSPPRSIPGLVETVLVVSPDAETLAWAAGFGPAVVPSPQPEHRSRSQWRHRRRAGMGVGPWRGGVLSCSAICR